MSLASPPLVSHLSSLPARGRFHAWALAVPVILGAMAVPAQPASAGTVTITISGSVASATPGMGYAVGDPVSFFFDIYDAPAAAPPGQVTPNDSYWTYTSPGGTPLFSSVGGTGLAGTFRQAASPYDYIQSYVNGRFDIEHDENNDGLYLAANPGLDLKYIYGEIVFAKPGFTGFIPDAVLPNPATYFAGYAGAYTVDSFNRFELQAGSSIAFFVPLSMTISVATAVPEISQAGLAGAAALLACGFGLVERRRRSALAQG